MYKETLTRTNQKMFKGRIMWHFLFKSTKGAPWTSDMLFLPSPTDSSKAHDGNHQNVCRKAEIICTHQDKPQKCCKRCPGLQSLAAISFLTMRPLCVFANWQSCKHACANPLYTGPWSVCYWYRLSKSKHPSASVGPDDSSLPGPELVFEGFVWFLVSSFMSVSMKMEDSCQWRGICLCHPTPPPSFHFSAASSLSLPPFFFFNPQTSQAPRSI